MKLSVLLSVHFKDRPDYLLQALQSLVDQTRRANEIVLVEDGPIGPELKDIIFYFRNYLPIRIVQLETNMGLGAALSEGLSYCSSDLVARMDADDVCLPERFEKQVKMFKSSGDIDVLGSFCRVINEAGEFGVMRTMPVVHEEIVSKLWTCPFVHPTVVFKKDKIISAGGYNPDLPRRQDYELWFRLARHGLRFHNLPEPLLLYRFSKNTHKKQSTKLAWEQAKIGFTESTLMKMAWWKRLACFFPFFRSLLPARIQHFVYMAARKYDPRLNKAVD
jgi:glycosyltransferase involved in cell wall biosynthesis